MNLNNLEDQKIECRWCKRKFEVSPEKNADFIVTEGTCSTCDDMIFKSKNKDTVKNYVDTINAPILVLQAEPRQVFTANTKACELFNKQLDHIEGYRGGQVFDCVQSFTEAGCGKDINCENCRIKDAIVETLTTSNSFENIHSPLDIKKVNIIKSYSLQISTEKAGDLALVRIDEYNPISND